MLRVTIAVFASVGIVASAIVVVLRATFLHRESLPFASRELIPDFLRFPYKVTVDFISFFFRPRVDQLPATFALHLERESPLQQFLAKA